MPEVWIVSSEQGEIFAVFASREIALDSVHWSWDNERFSRIVQNFENHTKIEIRTIPKIGEQFGQFITMIRIQKYELRSRAEHL